MGISAIILPKMIKEYSFFLSCFFQLIKLFTFLDGIFLTLVVLLIIRLITHRKKYRVCSVKINLPFSLGNITYEPTEIDRIVAWKLYTQLKTRKAALIFDENYDVIDKIYDSLYELFQINRDLLMNLPLYEIERQPNISDLIFRVLNDGIRPHLTKWQLDFHKWWDNAVNNPDNKDKNPQDIQKCYPKYTELIKELKGMNLELNKYAEDLLNIAKTSPHAIQKSKDKIKKPIPIQPSSELEKTNRK